MGTYGKLMELSKARQATVAEPKKLQPNEAVLTIEAQRMEEKLPLKMKRGIKQPSNRDTNLPRYHATMTPRYRDTTVEAIRASVKVFGKEAATHRWTIEEKKAIKEIMFTYAQQGIRTGENEISRIGVNFLIEDYRVNGENSLLHKVLKALNG